MEVIKHRGPIAAGKCRPDGKRFLRVCRNRTEAKDLLKRIDGATVNGTWKELVHKVVSRNV